MSDTSYASYAALMGIVLPVGVAIWAICCVVLPHTWRGFLRRATFCCPSFYLIWVGYVAWISLTIASLDDFAPKNATSGVRAFSQLAQSTGSGFLVIHTILTVVRSRFTLGKWQAIAMCEIVKSMMVGCILWGADLSRDEMQTSTYAFFAVGCAALIGVSALRLYWVIRCNFDADKFNASYFGVDSKCPVQRVYGMCLVLEKAPEVPMDELVGGEL
jgi:hypothetical protein